MIRADQIQTLDPARGQIIIGKQAGATNTSTVRGDSVVRAKGRIVSVWAFLGDLALTVGAVHDIIPKRCPVARIRPMAPERGIPIIAGTGLRLTDTLNKGERAIGALAPELVGTGLAQNGATATTMVLSAAETGLDGELSEAEVLIVDGLGRGQRNRIIGWTLGTKVADLLNAVGTPLWKVAPNNTSIYQYRTRKRVVAAGDEFRFENTYTAGGGGLGAGNEATCGVEIEFDSSVDA